MSSSNIMIVNAKNNVTNSQTYRDKMKFDKYSMHCVVVQNDHPIRLASLYWGHTNKEAKTLYVTLMVKDGKQFRVSSKRLTGGGYNKLSFGTYNCLNELFELFELSNNSGEISSPETYLRMIANFYGYPDCLIVK